MAIYNHVFDKSKFIIEIQDLNNKSRVQVKNLFSLGYDVYQLNYNNMFRKIKSNSKINTTKTFANNYLDVLPPEYVYLVRADIITDFIEVECETVDVINKFPLKISTNLTYRVKNKDDLTIDDFQKNTSYDLIDFKKDLTRYVQQNINQVLNNMNLNSVGINYLIPEIRKKIQFVLNENKWDILKYYKYLKYIEFDSIDVVCTNAGEIVTTIRTGEEDIDKRLLYLLIDIIKENNKPAITPEISNIVCSLLANQIVSNEEIVSMTKKLTANSSNDMSKTIELIFQIKNKVRNGGTNDETIKAITNNTFKR